MVIHRKLLTIAVILVLINLILGIVLYSYSSLGRSPIRCASLKEQFDKYECGYTLTSSDKKEHLIIGKILKKYQSKNDFFIELGLNDSKGKKISLPVALAPEKMGVFLTIFTPKNQVKNNESLHPSTKFSPSEAFKRLEVDKEVVVAILTPDAKETIEAQKKLGALKIFECLDYHRKAVDYLKMSSITGEINLQISRIQTGCYITSNQFSYYQ